MLIYYNRGKPSKLPPIKLNFLLEFAVNFLNKGNFDFELNSIKSVRKLLLISKVCKSSPLKTGSWWILLYFNSNPLNFGVSHLLISLIFYIWFLPALKNYRFPNFKTGREVKLLDDRLIILILSSLDLLKP